MNERLRRIGEELIPAVAFGDAAGLPTEMMSAERIQQEYGVLEALVPPDKHKIYIGDFPAGTWSDDTQLTIVVAEALMEADGFDLHTLAAGHVGAYNKTPQIVNSRNQRITRGWGGSTTRSVERIIDGASPATSGERDGAGNGIIMKMAPLVYWQVARNIPDAERYRQYDALTTMTHDSDLARMATRIHGDMLRFLMTGWKARQRFPSALHDAIRWHEREFSDGHEVLNELRYLLAGEPIDHELILRETDGRGFKVTQTLAMAYGAFMRGYDDLHDAVFGAVRLGGDTDSIASIVATMAVCESSHSLVQDQDVEQIIDIARIRALSKALANQALQRTGKRT